MKMDQQYQYYQPGYYIDYCPFSNWVSIPIIAVNQKGVQVKNIHYDNKIQFYPFHSKKIAPFRSQTEGKSLTSSNLRGEKYNQEIHQKHLDQLRLFDFKTAENSSTIIQHLRGRNFFYIEKIFTFCLKSIEELNTVIDYFKEHLNFVVRYLKQVKFPKTQTFDIYLSKQNAYASSYPQIIQSLSNILGMHPHKHQNSFCKQNYRLIPQGYLINLLSKWCQYQFLPTLIIIKNIPYKLFVLLFKFINQLIKRKIIDQSQSIKQNIIKFYQNLKQQIKILNYRQYNLLENIFNECDILILRFLYPNNGQARKQKTIYKLCLLAGLINGDSKKAIQQFKQSPPFTQYQKLQYQNIIKNWIESTNFIQHIIDYQHFQISKLIIDKISFIFNNQMIEKIIQSKRPLLLKLIIKKLNKKQQLILNLLNQKQQIGKDDIQLVLQIERQYQNMQIKRKCSQLFFKFIKLLKPTQWQKRYLIFIRQSGKDSKRKDLFENYLEKIISQLNHNNNYWHQQLLSYQIMDQKFQIDLNLFEKLCNWLQQDYSKQNRTKIHRIQIIGYIMKQLQQNNIQLYKKYLSIGLKTYKNMNSNSKVQFLRVIISHNQQIIQSFQQNLCSQIIQSITPITNQYQCNLFPTILKLWNLYQKNIVYQNNILIIKKGPLKYIQHLFDVFINVTSNSPLKKPLTQQIQKLHSHVYHQVQIPVFNYLFDYFLKKRLKRPDIFRLYNNIRKNYSGYIINPKINPTSPPSNRIFKITCILPQEERTQQFTFPAHYQIYQIKNQLCNKLKLQPRCYQIVYKQKMIDSSHYQYKLDSVFNQSVCMIKIIQNNKQKSTFTNLLLKRKRQIFLNLPQSDILWKYLPETQQFNQYIFQLIKRQKIPVEMMSCHQQKIAIVQIINDILKKKKIHHNYFNLQALACLGEHLRPPKEIKHLDCNIKMIGMIKLSKICTSQMRDKIIHSLLFTVPKHQCKGKDQRYINLAFEVIKICSDDNFHYFLSMDQSIFSQLENNSKVHNQLMRFWLEIYSEKSLIQKQQVFQSFQISIIHYKQNWLYFISAFDKIHVKQNQIQFYQNLMYKCIKFITQKQINRNNIQVPLQLIQKLLQLQIWNNQILSQQFCQFLNDNIYTYSLDSIVFEILPYVMNQPSKRKIFCQFFLTAINQPQWHHQQFFKPKKKRHHNCIGLVGLKNPHSICYINSFLQQLFYIKQFRKNLFKTHWQLFDNQQQDLIYQLKRTFINLQELQVDCYQNQQFCKAFKDIQGNPTSKQQQMDVDQFRSILFDRLQNLLPKDNNFVRRLFNGKQITKIKSKQCSHQSQTQQDFSSICLDVKGISNLQQSFTKYFNPQILQNDNAYFCQSCNKKVRAQKTFKISNYPINLIFVLKRFQFNTQRNFRIKINSLFQFPLDIFEVNQNLKYKLQGIITHQGFSQAGHYISYIKIKRNQSQKWYQFNDQLVTQFPLEQLPSETYGGLIQRKQLVSSNFEPRQNSKNAYLLFYRRQNYQEIQEIDNKYQGIQQEWRKIKKTNILLEKQKAYMNSQFSQLIFTVAKKHINIGSSTHSDIYNLLFFYVLRVKAKLDADSFDFFRIFQLLNKQKCPQLWISISQKFSLAMQFLKNKNISVRAKSLMVILMMNNYTKFDGNILQVLNILLRVIYQQVQTAPFYLLLLQICKRDSQACTYLFEKRIVGRILDLTFMGFLGAEVRENLKRISDIGFEIPLNKQSNQKQHQKQKCHQRSQYKFYKWKLLLYLLQNVNIKLHDVQKNLLFNHSPGVLKKIYDQCTNKTNIHRITLCLCFLASKSQQYNRSLINCVSSSLQKQDSNSMRKYLKTAKQLLLINDSRKQQRTKNIVQIFIKVMRDKYDHKTQLAFDVVWQWFIKIAKKNILFKKIASQKKHLLNWMFNIQKLISIIRNKENTQRIKNRYHGLWFPISHDQYTTYLSTKILQTQKILNNTQLNSSEWDSDADITDLDVSEGLTLYKYNRDGVGFQERTVRCAVGDWILFQNKEGYSRIQMAYKGDQQLTAGYVYQNTGSIRTSIDNQRSQDQSD